MQRLTAVLLQVLGKLLLQPALVPPAHAAAAPARAGCITRLRRLLLALLTVGCWLLLLLLVGDQVLQLSQLLQQHDCRDAVSCCRPLRSSWVHRAGTGTEEGRGGTSCQTCQV